MGLSEADLLPNPHDADDAQPNTHPDDPYGRDEVHAQFAQWYGKTLFASKGPSQCAMHKDKPDMWCCACNTNSGVHGEWEKPGTNSDQNYDDDQDMAADIVGIGAVFMSPPGQDDRSLLPSYTGRGHESSRPLARNEDTFIETETMSQNHCPCPDEPKPHDVESLRKTFAKFGIKFHPLKPTVSEPYRLCQDKPERTDAEKLRETFEKFGITWHCK